AIARSEASSATLRDASQRMFDSACGACHHDGAGPRLLGLNIPLALNSNLHGTRPDNLVRIIMEGIRTPPSTDIGFMPAFKDSLSDQQIADLAVHMRQRFAPDKAAWVMSKGEVARIRAASNASTH
ncbi:MAG: putative isoquinoline 1-oxidoreductase, subunit beta, partial [Rhizobacter sp.]|nr:putative isoquinoline 1-oxidoreductase, subunit beta [Rhizobacter sp.]